MTILRALVASRTSILPVLALAASMASGIAVAPAAAQSPQGRGTGEPSAAVQARITELRRQAVAKQTEAERLGRAIADLDAQIGPKESAAAAGRRQAAERQEAARRLRNEAATFDRQAGAFDRGRALAAPLQTVRGAAAGLENFRSGLGQHANRFEEILGAQVRPGALAGQFRSMADQVERAGSPADLDRITRAHEASILRALRGERQQIANGLGPFQAQVKQWQDKIDQKKGEIRYWETQKREHAAKRDDAARRYNASCHDVFGQKLCTDAVALGQYTYESAGVTQADGAISLANGEISVYWANQLIPTLNVNFRQFFIRLYDNAIGQAEQQARGLLQITRDWGTANAAREQSRQRTAQAQRAEQEAAAASQEANRLDREAAPLKARRAEVASQRQRQLSEAQQLVAEAARLASPPAGRRASRGTAG